MHRPVFLSTISETPTQPFTAFTAGMISSRVNAIPASMREGSVRIVVERAYTVHPLFSGAAPRWRHRSTNHHPPIGPRCVEAIQMPARRRASVNTSSSIAGVNRPVNMFCWLGW